MPCRLCKRGRPLLRSHTIPEFLYRDLYDAPHQFEVVHLHSGESDRRLQKGVRERLLCQGCERALQKYEHYAARELRVLRDAIQPLSGYRFTFTGLDYAKFKLFQLSVLWRMAASSDRFLERVRLGAEVELLRTMVAEGRPGEPHEYGVMMIGVIHRGHRFEAFTQPCLRQVAGSPFYVMNMAGFTWCFHAAVDEPSPGLSKWFLQKSGELSVTVVELRDVPYLQQMGDRLHEIGKL